MTVQRARPESSVVLCFTTQPSESCRVHGLRYESQETEELTEENGLPFSLAQTFSLPFITCTRVISVALGPEPQEGKGCTVVC